VNVEDAARPSESMMKWLELGAAYFLVALFAIGVLDLGLSLYRLVASGQFTDPNAVIDLIDTVLLLLIIVEVYQTVIAFTRDEDVLRIVINAAFIAIARKVISFRLDEFGSTTEALVAAVAFGVLLAVLLAAFFVIRRVEPPRMPVDDSPPTTGGTPGHGGDSVPSDGPGGRGED
jgi:uncharacterized membrane protein (DUF373 family)